MVRFLSRHVSDRGIRQLLRLVAEGKRFEDALSEATGYTTESLEEGWRKRFRPSGFERALRAVFGPGRVLLWTALFVVAGFFVVKYRRRRAAERLDEFP